MADENFGIVVEIDPRPALAGTTQVDRALEKNEQSARDFEREAKAAMAEVGKAAREAAKEQERSARAAAKIAADATKQAARDAAAVVKKEARDAAAAAKEEALKREKVEQFVAKRTADYAAMVTRERKQAQAGLAAAYRQIVGPAAEYREKLNQIIQLERQGAITAQQRANAIRGMQREMAAHNAKQQGGVRGAVSEIASSQLGAVAGPAAAAAAAVTVGKELIELGDQYTALTNKIRASTESEAEAIRIRERLFKTANDARVPVEALTNLYAQARIATKDLGTSQGELIRVSELLSKATRGVGEANRSAGLQQFGQALTKGKLQAEELMSIMENIPRVGVLLAEGMGMTVGELRKAAEAGKVGTQEMLDAIQKMGPAIEQEFTNASGTAAESWAVFKNQVLQTAGGFAAQIHLNELLTGVLGQVGEALKGIGVLVAGTVDNWKAINDATGGWLGKLVKAPGLLGRVAELQGMIAGQYLFGAEMLERQAAWSERLARDAEKRTGELEKQLVILSNSTFYGGYSRDEKGRATGYGVAGNFLRDSISAYNNPSRGRADKQEERDAEKAARDHASAVRQAAAAWKEWMGDVREGGAGVLERTAMRIEDVTSSVRDLAAESIATAEATRVANENMIALATTVGEDLLASISDAADMLSEFAEKSDEVFGRHSIEEQMMAEIAAAGLTMGKLGDLMSVTLGNALGDTLDAIVDFANGAEVSFSELARSVVADIEKMILKLLVFEGIKAALGGIGGADGLIGAIGSALGFGGFAAGGSFTVPNSGGGTDSVPVAFRATPGERVTISPPGSSGGAERAAPQPVNVNAYLVHDAEAASIAAINTPAGTRAIIAAIAANPGAVRAAVGR